MKPPSSAGRAEAERLESEIMELQRRIGTLTAALSDKAEENVEYAREVELLRRQGPLGQAEHVRREQESREMVEKMRAERQAQEELNLEFQRRITTLSVCLTELADMNAAVLASQAASAREAERRIEHNESLRQLGRQAALGLVSVDDLPKKDQSGTAPPDSSLATPDRSNDHSNDNGSTVPLTPQLLQDYQGEIERLKFRLRKRKAKIERLKEAAAHEKDLADAAKKSCTKYEKEIRRLNREMSEALEKEVGRRKKTEQMAKSLQRKIGELEFLLENEASSVDEPASPMTERKADSSEDDAGDKG